MRSENNEPGQTGLLVRCKVLRSLYFVVLAKVIRNLPPWRHKMWGYKPSGITRASCLVLGDLPTHINTGFWGSLLVGGTSLEDGVEEVEYEYIEFRSLGLLL